MNTKDHSQKELQQDEIKPLPSFSKEIKKSPSTPNFHKFAGGDERHQHCNSSLNKSSIQLHDSLPIHNSVKPDNMSTRDSLVDLYMDNGQESPVRSKLDRNGSFISTTLRRQSNIPDPQHFDRYGFRKKSQYVTEEEYDQWWGEYSQYCIRRKHKWQNFLVKSGLSLNNDSPEKFPAQSEKVKRYVRKGIPAEWRGNAWWYFARGDEMLSKNKNLYAKLVEKIETAKHNKTSIRDVDVIERDLNRTFPDNIHFHRESFQTEEPFMIQALRRVLLAFSIYDSEIGYCQSMNFLAALLLLFLDEEKAFWMLVIITKKYLPGVHSVSLEGVNVDQGVLILCIKEYLPELWIKMEASMLHSTGQKAINQIEILNKLPPITLSTASWFMSCFVGVVPIETTLRIWDCLFYEKSHFLFKISLAILKLSEEELLERKLSIPQSIFATFSSESLDYTTSNGGNGSHVAKQKIERMNQDDYDMLLFQVIQTYPKKLINPNDIFEKVIFKKKMLLNRLDQEEIDKVRKYVTSQRDKWTRFGNIINNDNSTKFSDFNNSMNDGSESDNISMSNEDVLNTLESEMTGFKRISLTGVNWNNSFRERVKSIRKQK
ncbi:GTPase-activating protein GYP3 [Monosporozyma servazzii]